MKSYTINEIYSEQKLMIGPKKSPINERKNFNI